MYKDVVELVDLGETIPKGSIRTQVWIDRVPYQGQCGGTGGDVHFILCKGWLCNSGLENRTYYAGKES
jgi:hypothetical protein